MLESVVKLIPRATYFFGDCANFRRLRGLFMNVDEQAPDVALAVAAAAGNVDAFSELARRYRRAALRVAAAISGQDAAEDIVQDALLLAFRSIADLEEPAYFAAWLAAITRNRALRLARREGRIARVDLDAGIEAHLKEIADADRRRESAATDLLEGMDDLPHDLRLVMRLRWLDEMPMSQIAAFTGLPLSTVKWRLYQGRKQLRAWARNQEKRRPVLLCNQTQSS